MPDLLPCLCGGQPFSGLKDEGMVGSPPSYVVECKSCGKRTVWRGSPINYFAIMPSEHALEFNWAQSAKLQGEAWNRMNEENGGRDE